MVVANFEFCLRAGGDRRPALKEGDRTHHLSPLAHSLKAAGHVGRGPLNGA
jgi:hypothetical protein